MELCIDGKYLETKDVCETKMLSRELEDVIESFAVGVEEDSRMLDILICSRHDCRLLDCRRTIVPVQSTLGFMEESIIEKTQLCIDSANSALNITLFEALSVSCNSTCTTFPPPPHSEWTRTRSDCKQEQAPKQQSDVLWVDLQNTSVELTAPSDCCHFLRSLLGSSHHASPWGDDSDEKNYDAVAVVLTTASETLQRFRTTDASPSYFLHSISRLQIPSNDAQWWAQRSPTKNGDRCEATLLVYKKLPPRDAHMLQNPQNPSQNLTEGCMFESYCRQADNDADDDDNGEIRMQEFWRQVAPPYINHQQDYSTLMEPLIELWQTIRDEALAIPQWTAWPEKNHYSANPKNPDSPTWTVFPLCHCFPASQVENKKWIEATCAFVPKTISLLREHLGDHLRTALFSRLDPETTLEAHTGWEDLANHVYRLHLPLVVPSGGLCGTWVDGAVETHEEGRPLCFDDSKIHRAFNYSTEDRIVLILDIARPPSLPLGTASGGHTEELDDFINTLT